MQRICAAVVVLGVSLGMVSGASAAAGPCPNEALRSEDSSMLLPECRAYEQVTPPYKEGQEVFDFATAPNGNQLITRTTAQLAGNPGTGVGIGGAGYLDARTQAGWQLSGLNPSVSTYSGQYMFAANGQTGQTLWALHQPTQSAYERALYVRTSGGEWDYVGPLFPPDEAGTQPSEEMEQGEQARPVAATSDYSHVLVFAPNEFDRAGHKIRWPFDETAAGSEGSLYEYAGTDNAAPTLVGVTGSKGSHELIGRCGVVLGSNNLGLGGSVYNALSADGEVVYFTPLSQDMGNGRCSGAAKDPSVAEVYARVGGSSTSPRSAETIDVSSRSTSECDAACAGSKAADKLFEGASTDGSKVFFASTQDLINGASEDTTTGDSAIAHTLEGEEFTGCSATTGPGGCNLYEYELDTHHLSLVAGSAEVLGVARIAEDGSHVYFVARAALGEGGGGGEKLQLAPEAGQPNLYVFDTDTRETKYIATLSGADAGDWAQPDTRPVQASEGEGRFLLFESEGSELTTDDHSSRNQMFEYDSATSELVRVSKGEVVSGEAAEVAAGDKGEVGYDENGNAVSFGVTEGSLAGTTIFNSGEDFQQSEPGAGGTYVSADGKTVAFISRGRLSPRAISAEDGCRNVYAYHVEGEGIVGGSVRLISDGADVQPRKQPGCYGSVLEAMSADGANIYFSTADPLLKSDTDGLQRDIYDAHVDGGFPQQASLGECEAEACHGALATPLAFAKPSSETQTPNETSSSLVSVPPTPAFSVLKCSREGASLRVRLKINSAGTVSIFGRGVKTTTKALKAGVYTVAVALGRDSVAALRHHRKLELVLTVALSPRAGQRYAQKLTFAGKG